MSVLSPRLEQLVQAGRIALRPTETDAARVLVQLRARLGKEAVPAAKANLPQEACSATGVLNDALLVLAFNRPSSQSLHGAQARQACGSSKRN